MQDIWIMSNRPLEKHEGFTPVVSKPPVYFYINTDHYLIKSYPNKDLVIVVDGYVLPRMAAFDEYRHLEPALLIFELYQKYGKDFIRHVKGIFNIVVIDGDNYYIFNDRSGIRKFFYYSHRGNMMFTNHLESIADRYPLSISREHAALFGLMEHFIDGMTLFSEVDYSTPASRVIFSGSLEFDHYWHYFDLIESDTREYSFGDFSFFFRDNIANYIRYFNSGDITMTLTGGNDSRTILSALLNINGKPRAFTFGNPLCYDGVVAKKIAEKMELDYSCYFASEASAEWFQRMGAEIIPLGHSLINIHRAHRLDAIQKEKQRFPGVDMLLAGFMGGDYIKGMVYNDYITAKLVRLWEFTGEDLQDLLAQLLKERYFRAAKLDLDYIFSKLAAQPYFSRTGKIRREFSYIFSVVGAQHDAQDTNIFNAYVKYVVNIFMDIDFLELLFSSPYSMKHKDNSSRNQLKRLMQPALHCHIIDTLAPALSDIEFSKHYSPKEFLGNKLIYAAKRLYRYYFYKKFPAGFPYLTWFVPFVKQSLENPHPFINDLFDLKQAKQHLNNNPHRVNEGYWHPFTNMINLDMIIKYYTGI